MEYGLEFVFLVLALKRFLKLKIFVIFLKLIHVKPNSLYWT